MHFSFDHIVCFTLAALLHLLVLLFAGNHLAAARQTVSETEPKLEVVSVELTLEGAAPETPAAASSSRARADDAKAASLPPVPASSADEPPPLPPPLPLPQPAPAAVRPTILSTAEPAKMPEPDLPADGMEAVPSPDPRTDDGRTSVSVAENEFPGPDIPGPVATLEPGGGASGHIDAHPSLARPIRPNYPIGARRRGEEGTVILDVNVAADGRAERVTLVSSSGFPELDRAAERAAAQARFKPATRDRQPFASAARLTLIFRLRDS